MLKRSSDSREEGGWWGYGWLQTAKEKSKAALEMVQKDLAEYTCTMSADTSKAVAETSDKLKETLKAENTSAAKDRFKTGVTSFLEGLSKALVIEAEDKNEPVKTHVNSEAVYDRAKARLHAIQVDLGTYCSEPTGSQEKYQEWQKSFDLEAKKGEVSELLVSKVELRAFYTKLVPAEISHADFWKRYFYKVHQLQQDEARKSALMKRAEQAQKKEDSISWEDDWSGDEESAPEKLSHKQELSERLSPSQKISKETSSNNETEMIRNEESVKNETRVTNGANSLMQDTGKEKIPSESVKTSPADILETQKSENIQESVPEQINDQEITTEIQEETVEESSSQDQVHTTSCKSDGKESTSAVKDSKPDLCTPVKDSKPDLPKSEMTEEEVKTKDKGDMVVVNPDRVTPSSDSNKENSTDDDWERDFDVELTEEELKAADEIAKKLNLSAADYTTIAGEMDEDWESWD
ncbi:BSD domain-containing protein 1-like isoform X2 [Ostrea edulis]|uniref:BSD domain-containing protein 1-like isoform X2 n=1 Tax=Ostrea edulis TaxID=37623 RepID=UPI0024AF9C10|nr:BSD domain-containing protein 1-like isoform X2 [Ostrea edulis]